MSTNDVWRFSTIFDPLPGNCLSQHCQPGKSLPENCKNICKKKASLRIACLIFNKMSNNFPKKCLPEKCLLGNCLLGNCLSENCLPGNCLPENSLPGNCFLYSKMRIQWWYLSFCTKWNEWSKLNQADNRFPISLLLSACTDDPNCQWWWFYNKCIDVEIGEYP